MESRLGLLEARPIHSARAGGARTRAWACLVLAACAAVLGLAAWLKPDQRGYGTHEQLGFAPCGWLVVSRYPCPTCGMTTAFCHAVRGQWVRGFLAQPAGFVFALGTMVTAVAAAWTALTGRWPGRLTAWLTPFRVCLGLLVVLLGAWGWVMVWRLAHHALPAG